ncbi:MAG: 2-C-methyl-D-erythritol 2,4-cyclodiphosphate synthase [Pyrinomonadaceae bacterium]
MSRIGFGTDIHKLVSGRRLVLGGLEIESELGAEGHSDADALTHAITDAILGALGLGDIGTHFPNSDERWRNAESFLFLKYAAGLVQEHGYTIGNVDSVVTLETPVLRPYIDRIRESLANVLAVERVCVNVKAKSNERLDAIGRGEGVKAEAIVLLERAPGRE